jgi:flagellar biosynthesis protein FliR
MAIDATIPSLLEQFLVGELFAYLLIFARIGAGLMVMPGIGETYIAPRVRLLLALCIALVLHPTFSPLMPPVPNSPIILVIMVSAEILVGLFFGFLARLLVSTLHVAGTIIAYQSSLALAAFFDATQNAQSTVIGNFLTISAVVLFFTLDIHHVMINGLAASYGLFTPGQFPIIEDIALYLVQTLSAVFAIAVQLSAPHIVFSLVFYLGSGILARLMPNMQVFFVLMPTQIIIGFFLLMTMLQSILFNYAQFVEESLQAFLQ